MDVLEGSGSPVLPSPDSHHSHHYCTPPRRLRASHCEGLFIPFLLHSPCIWSSFLGQVHTSSYPNLQPRVHPRKQPARTSGNLAAQDKSMGFVLCSGDGLQELQQDCKTVKAQILGCNLTQMQTKFPSVETDFQACSFSNAVYELVMQKKKKKQQQKKSP